MRKRKKKNLNGPGWAFDPAQVFHFLLTKPREQSRARESNGNPEGNPDAAASGGDDPTDGAGGRGSTGAAGGTGARTVPAEPDGVLQRLQRENAEVQGGDADGGDDNGVQGQHLRVHGEVAVGDVVPEEGGGDRVREREAGARDGVDGVGEARV